MLPAAPRLSGCLENELAAQFKHAGIPRAVDLAERVARVQHGAERTVLRIVARIQAVRFSVVEGVERLNAQFKVRPLGNRERLIDRRCEVDATGANNGIFAGIAEAEV